MAWLTAGALMLAWFSIRAFAEPRFIDVNGVTLEVFCAGEPGGAGALAPEKTQ